jgi:hypothetical protein
MNLRNGGGRYGDPAPKALLCLSCWSPPFRSRALLLFILNLMKRKLLKPNRALVVYYETMKWALGQRQLEPQSPQAVYHRRFSSQKDGQLYDAANVALTAFGIFPKAQR